MSKSKTIIVRVDGGLKARIEAAASRQGKSITTFVLEAAENAARMVETMQTTQKPKGRGACPTWFVATCHEATQGGAGGYKSVGYALAKGLASVQDWDKAVEEWQEALDQLGKMVSGVGSWGHRGTPDDEKVWGWFEKHLPRCVALIPRRRRQAFLAGVYQAAADESIVLEM